VFMLKNQWTALSGVWQVKLMMVKTLKHFLTKIGTYWPCNQSRGFRPNWNGGRYLLVGLDYPRVKIKMWLVWYRCQAQNGVGFGPFAAQWKFSKFFYILFCQFCLLEITGAAPLLPPGVLRLGGLMLQYRLSSQCGLSNNAVVYVVVL
jgi:hypothetical protein